MESPKRRGVKRSQHGAALSEFGPAIFLIFVFGLLPVLDALFIGIDYASARYLNEMQLREAQKLPRSKAIAPGGSIVQSIPEQWKGTLLAGLASANHPVETLIDYKPVPWQPVGSNQTENFWFVTITTTASFRPFFVIPFFNGVAGLGAPITFSVSGRAAGGKQSFPERIIFRS